MIEAARSSSPSSPTESWLRYLAANLLLESFLAFVPFVPIGNHVWAATSLVLGEIPVQGETLRQSFQIVRNSNPNEGGDGCESYLQPA